MSNGFIGGTDFGFLASGGGSSPSEPYLPLTLDENTSVVQGIYDLDFQSTNPSGASFIIERVQTQANESDTDDSALEVNFTLGNNLVISDFEFIQRAIKVVTTNNNSSTPILFSRNINSVANTSAFSFIGTHDHIYIENGTTDGAVNNDRGVVVSNLQGTSNAAFVSSSLSGTNNTLLLLGTETIPSDNWGVYQSENSFKNYFQGNTLLGTTTDNGLAKLQVTGSVSSSSLVGTGTRGVVTNASGVLSAAPTWIYVPKNTTTSRQSNTVLASDPDLQFVVPRGSKANFRLTVYYTGDTTADFKYSYNATNVINGGLYVQSSFITPSAAAGLATLVTRNVENSFQGVSVSVTYTASNLPGQLNMEGFIDAVAVVGAMTFAFQWAQNTSVAANTSVLRGSFLEYIITQ